MEFGPEFVIPIAIDVTLFSIATLVFLADKKSQVHKIFSLSTLFLCVWLLSSTMANFAQDYNSALFWTQMAIVGPFLFLPAFAYLTFCFPQKLSGASRFFKIAVISALAPMPFVFTSLNVRSIELKEWGTEHEPGVLYSVLLGYIIIFGLIALKNLYKSYFNSKNLRHKKQVLGIVFAWVCLVFVGAATNLVLPLFLNYSKGVVYGPSIAMFLFTFFLSFSILRYRFLNLRIIVTQTLSVVLVLLFFIQIFFAASQLEFVVRGVFFICIFVLAVVLIDSLNKEQIQKDELLLLTKRLQQANEDLGLRNHFLDFMQRFTTGITRGVGLDQISKEVVNRLAERDVFLGSVFYVIRPKTRRLVPIALTNHLGLQEYFKQKGKALTHFKLPYRKSGDCPVCKSLRERKIIYGENVEKFLPINFPKGRREKIQEDLEIASALSVPLKTEDKNHGALVLLLKKQKKDLTEFEIDMINILADQVSIIVRNAFYYRKSEETNLELEILNEELKKLDRAKSDFLSIASHQLRTPLTVIKGYASMLSEGFFGEFDNKPVNKVLDRMFMSTERLINLVNELLDVSRIESGDMEFKIGPVDLVELGKDVVEEMSEYAKSKEIKIVFHPTPHHMAPVKADGRKLREVVINLVDNAIKYSPENTEVNIYVYQKESDGFFNIVDQGMGIDPIDLSRLFKRFSRIDETYVTKVGGSGLGLFVCKKIITAFNGKIWAESKGKEKGSSFTFGLPLMK